jgi:hypothetical protein
MEKLRVVITGVGKIGFLHTGILKSLKNSTLTTKSENDEMNISLEKKYFQKVKYFEEYKKMFNHKKLIAVCNNSNFLIRF